MSKLWKITLCHNDIEVIRASQSAYYKTATHRDHTENVFIDHSWPIDYWNHRHQLLNLAESYGARVIAPYKNLGGHGGISWAISQLPIEDTDYILTFDCDSIPITLGWDHALLTALNNNPNMAYCSLMHEHILGNRKWSFLPNNEAPRIVQPDSVEMQNITLWRPSFLKLTGGLHGGAKYYGSVELSMEQRKFNHRMISGYLWDYRETGCPIAFPPSYIEWKRQHLLSYKENFDQWCREHNIT